MRKNNNNVDIPINWRHGYTLCGGIVHMGSLNGGHYIYYGYNNKISKWFIANDSSISIINDVPSFIENTVSQSYILYYKK